MERLNERTIAVVNLSLLEHNVKNIYSRLENGVGLIAVLKADGYGHGEQGIYPTLKKCGVEQYAVAFWEEGKSLRNAGATEPILMLGDTCDGQLNKLITYNLTATIFSLDTAKKLNKIAKQSGVVQPINIKIDTGMSRIGFPANDNSVKIISEINAMENLNITGVFTHFSKADEEDGVVINKQLNLYLDMVSKLEKAGVKVPFKHVASSPAVLVHPEIQLDAVRVGDLLYGLCPVESNGWNKQDLRQILSWYTYVAMVKEVPAGTEVSYGGTFVAKRPTKIATIPVGFADGYNRQLSNKGKVLINGKEAPVIGKVCMDQFMVDVTDIDDIQRGDTVTLLDENLSVLWMADLLGVNVDEIVCGISKRVPRIYR